MNQSAAQGNNVLNSNLKVVQFMEHLISLQGCFSLCSIVATCCFTVIDLPTTVIILSLFELRAFIDRFV